MEYLSCSREVEILIDDMDFRENLKISALLQYFQLVATRHADILNIGYSQLKANGLIWVIYSMSVEVLSQPKVSDIVSVITFPKKSGAVDALRDFYITDSNGNNIVKATARWCVLDIVTRRVQRCKPIFSHIPENLFRPDNALAESTPKLKSIEQLNGYKKAYDDFAKLSDMDRNVHVNNVKYGDYIYNAFDTKFLDNKSIKRIDLNFLSELVSGESFSVYKAFEQNSSYIEITKAGNIPVMRAKIQWNIIK